MSTSVFRNLTTRTRFVTGSDTNVSINSVPKPLRKGSNVTLKKLQVIDSTNRNTRTINRVVIYLYTSYLITHRSNVTLKDSCSSTDTEVTIYVMVRVLLSSRL